VTHAREERVQDTDEVAVVVPFYKPRLNADEEVSLAHLEHYLGAYPRYLAAAETCGVALDGFELKRFPDRYFATPITYSALLVTPAFYEAFAEFRFVLIYQLDCLVFADRLLEWCAQGYDYVGAPWFDGDFGAGFNVNLSEQPAVGNGGFSLRRVAAFREVLRSRRLWLDPKEHTNEFLGTRPDGRRYSLLTHWPLSRFAYFNGVRSETRRWIQGTSTSRLCFGHEDLFWSFVARHYLPGFRTATVQDALRFSFELHPRKCFELSGGKLPFGCHAWAKYDREFWEPYLLSPGATVRADGRISR
jgi:hypothetical protein